MLRNTQEVSILPTSRTPEETPSPQEQATSSSLVRERNPSSPSYPTRALSSVSWKKERKDSSTKVEEATKMLLSFSENE
jgi:hypothetical protein